jgi:hypothetical protein
MVTLSSSHTLDFGENNFSNYVKKYIIWLKTTRNFWGQGFILGTLILTPKVL